MHKPKSCFLYKAHGAYIVYPKLNRTEKKKQTVLQRFPPIKKIVHAHILLIFHEGKYL